MSYVEIQTALEQKLEAMLPGFATVYENESYQPIVGTPYQRISFLPNKTADLAITADVREYYGLFQILLCYPSGIGRGAAQAHADSIDTEFEPVQNFTNGSSKIEIIDSVNVSPGFQDGDRWIVPVTVSWQSFKN